MGVRLNKVLSELNIGLQTAVDYLKRRPELGEIKSDASPNTKISDIQYEALAKYFNKNGNKITWPKQKKPETPKTGANSTKTVPPKKQYLDKLNKPLIQKDKDEKSKGRPTNPLDDFDWDVFENGVQSTINEDDDIIVADNQQGIVTGVVISIDKKEVIVNIAYKQDGIIPASEFRYNPDLKVGDSVEVYVEGYERGRVILSHKKARLSKAWDKVNELLDDQETTNVYVKCRTKGGLVVDLMGIEAFLPGSQIEAYQIKNYDQYVGKTIGVKIIKVNNEFRNVVVSRKAVLEEEINRKATDKNTLKEIWQKHTEVQEQILRQRTAPITIVPEASIIKNEKLHVRADVSDNTDGLKQEIIKVLDLDEADCHFDEGYVLASLDNWLKVSESDKSRISSKALRDYVNFSFSPEIDGIIIDKNCQYNNVKRLLNQLDIEFAYDKKHRLQIAIEQLEKLKENEDFKNLKLSFPDEATAIIPVYPSILWYLEKLCPNHNFQNTQKFKKNSDGGISIDKRIIVDGGYFKEETLELLRPIFDMRLYRVEFRFIMKESALKSYDWDENKSDLPKPVDGVIIFNKRFVEELSDCVDANDEHEEIHETGKPKQYTVKRTISDVDLEYSLCNKSIKRIFGEDSYTFEDTYYYKYEDNKSWASTDELDRFNDQLHLIFQKQHGISVASDGSSIGIDFNWKEQSLTTILTELSHKYPYINYSLFKKGHKCNFDIEYKKAELAGVMEELHNSFEDLKIELVKKGSELAFSKEFESFDDLLTFKTLLVNKLNSFDLNRYQFTFDDVPANMVKLLFFHDIQSRNEERMDAARELKGADFMIGDLKIGKLIRTASYPELVFDISGDNYETTKQLVEGTIVDRVEPDLSGDLEKLARLKDSLNRIISGIDIENPSLGTFIFDASQAGGIKDFEENIRLQKQEIGKHILNNKINNNEPQKDAIAKAILAPDLAIIQGPPGTGKSTAIAELIWQHIRQNPQCRVLLTSETNLAVDNAIDRIVNNQHNLVKPVRIGDESRLETEGLQFSYTAMERWAKGEDFSDSFIDDDDDDELQDENVYESPEKLILINWMENIRNRADNKQMPEEAFELWSDLLSNPSDDIRKLFFDNYIANCNVIGATCSSIGQKNIIFTESMENTGKKSKFIPTAFYKIYRKIYGSRNNYNPPISFDVVIQDESSKATPAELSLPLIYGKKNVIIGDHRQLPPMLSLESFMNSFDYLIKREKDESKKKELESLKLFVSRNFKKLEISHFERLFNQIDPTLKGVFNYQFRMHPAINEVIKQFYKDDGGLECGLVNPVDLGIDDPDFINNGASRYHGITAGPITPNTHVLWIDTDTPEMLDGTSRVNYGEVEVIRKVLSDIYSSPSFHAYNNKWDNIEDKQIGLISFYGKQLRLLRDMARGFDKEKLPIRISTVDRFQGMERNIIIVSMVRSHLIQTERGQKPNFVRYKEGYPAQSELGFAQSPNRLNVALSRAKRLLIIVGDSKLFRTKEIYDNVYNTIMSHENGEVINYGDYGL